MIDYRIILPYQEPGHEDRPWFLIRIEALDTKNNDEEIIGYLKIAWNDVDRPNWCYVDYSRVSYIYRRQGIATKMYKIGAAWLATNRKTCLTSSSVQSKSAKQLWAGLKKTLPIFQKEPTDSKHIYDCLQYTQVEAKKILGGIPECSQGRFDSSKYNFKWTEPIS